MWPWAPVTVSSWEQPSESCCFSSSHPSPSRPAAFFLLWGPQQLFFPHRPGSAQEFKPGLPTSPWSVSRVLLQRKWPGPSQNQNLLHGNHPSAFPCLHCLPLSSPPPSTLIASPFPHCLPLPPPSPPAPFAFPGPHQLSLSLKGQDSPEEQLQSSLGATNTPLLSLP